MDDRGLHPRLVQLLRDQGWDGLTAAQDRALAPLLAGKHVLLIAPTGYGKTEAALIPVLSRLLTERDRLHKAGKPWPLGFKVLYVTPLRALNRDLLRRLKSWGEALELNIGVRHGDTTTSERAKQAKSPPDLLITTPETVQLLLYGDTLRKHLATVRFVVLDEVHDLAQSERGAQLLVALERIEEVLAQPVALREAKAPERAGPAKPSAKPGGAFQRIGVSATVAEPSAVAHWLGGRGRDVEVVKVDATKEIRLTVLQAEPVSEDQPLAGRFGLPPTVVAQMRAIRRIAQEHERVLVFHNTRDGAELLASRSALLDDEAGKPQLLGLHHGSLSAEVRADVEERFKSGALRAIVATSSLELGIDVGAIDHVVQVGSPRSVARLVQRLGRSGHRVGGIAAGTLLANGAEDLLECLAVARRAKEGRLEPLSMRVDPLVVLANQVVALSQEYAGVQKEWARAVMKRAGCFLELDDGLFDAAWETLLDVKTLYPHEERRNTMGRSGRGRRHFLDHISLIPDETTFRVIDESTKRSIGTVDDAFVTASMAPGALVVMAGRSWRVVEVDGENAKVRVAPVQELGPVPQWTGSQLPVSFELAQETAKLRRLLVDEDKEADAYPLDKTSRAKALEPLRKHRDAKLVVPSDRHATVEVARRIAIANVALGTRGNEALGRITAALLGQKIGAHVAVESDAYRIQFTFASQAPADDLLEVWTGLKPDGLDLLLALVLRDSPLVRYHLVHVAKQFGALPSEFDPNKTARSRLDGLFAHLALQEETLARLIHDRMDVAAVQAFARDLAAGKLDVTIQAQGPVSFLGQDDARGLVAMQRTDEAVLAAVRQRIEDSDALLVCATCASSWQSKVSLLPKSLRCRRCSSIQIACLRPWNEDRIPLLRRKDVAKFTPEEKAERDRMHRNAAIVAAFGSTACRCLVARGVGPDTAARILQKTPVPAQPAFWREILLAELNFARTSAYWAR